MSYIRISSDPKHLRSGEELFNLKNKTIGYEESSNNLIKKSCDIEDGVTLIKTYERFYTGHDDSEIVIDILDKDNNILWSWSFDYVMGTKAEKEAETLIDYLETKFACPVSKRSWF